MKVCKLLVANKYDRLEALNFLLQPLDKDMEIEDILGKKMKAIDIFTHALSFIKGHFLQEIKTLFKEKDIYWILTVPAIWSDLAKTFMRTAATNVSAFPFSPM